MSTNCAYTTCLDFDIVVTLVTAQFLLLIVRIQQIQKLSLYLYFSRGDSNVINLLQYLTRRAQDISTRSLTKQTEMMIRAQ